MTSGYQADFRTLVDQLSPEGKRLTAAVTADMADHLDEVRWAVAAQILVEIPEFAHAPRELLDGLDRTIDAYMTLLRGMLGTWTDPSSAIAPPEAIAWSRDVAAQGFPVEVLLKVYRLGHAGLWQIWVRQLGVAAEDSVLQAETSAATWAYIVSYLEAVIDPIVAAHQAERERLLRRDQSIAEAELRRILRGDAVDVHAASSRLRYRLDRWHLGFVVWAEGYDDELGAHLARAGADVVDQLGYVGNAVTVPAARGVLHGWLGDWQASNRSVRPELGGGIHVAFGDPGTGIAGFRQTHEHAKHARRVAQLGRVVPACTDYRDVVVAALLSENSAHAREFVASTLGGVLDRDDADQLLETMAVYQQEALSLSRAAARLHVHRNTVTYRVRKVLESSGESDAGSLRLRAAVALAGLVPQGDSGTR